MGQGRDQLDATETQRFLRQLFNSAAAMSLAVVCRLDAEPEMSQLLDAVKAHPEQRPFVVRLFIESFSESFHMRHAPVDLVMFCMSDLRWPELRDFVLAKRDEDVKTHRVVCYNVWNDILEAFEDGWREKYFQDFTKKSD